MESVIMAVSPGEVDSWYVLIHGVQVICRDASLDNVDY